MALVTKVIIRLMRQPELVKTLLAVYDTRTTAARPSPRSPAVHHAGSSRNARRRHAANGGRSYARRISIDAAAVLLIELEGLTESVEEQVEQIEPSA